MGKILALDMSTKRTGWCIYQGQDTKVEYGVISSTSTDLQKRITVMREGIINLIKEYGITTVVIEEVRHDGYNNRTAKALMWLQGCIAVAIYECNKKIDVNYIEVGTWRRILGIKQGRGVKREEQKKNDIEYVNNHGFNLSQTQDDEADAIAICMAFVKDAGAIVITGGRPAPQEEESAF